MSTDWRAQCIMDQLVELAGGDVHLVWSVINELEAERGRAVRLDEAVLRVRSEMRMRRYEAEG